MTAKNSWLLLILAATLVMAAGCETREESIVRERSYVADYPPEAVAHYYRDVPYAEVDGQVLTLDVSAPEGDGPFPAVMIIHGGGWVLHTCTIMEGMARYLTNRGYVVFNINYRVRPDVSLVQIVEDCLGALIWVKEHAADYHADPARVAVTGDSAGGHLTAMLVTQADNPIFTPTYRGSGKVDLSIACAAPSYGVYDFVSLTKAAPWLTRPWFDEKYKDDPETYKLLSPLLHVQAGLPPQLVIVGNQDPLYSENKKYVRALQAAGSPVELWVYPGQGHAFLNNFWDERGQKGYDRILEFLDQNLKP